MRNIIIHLLFVHQVYLFRGGACHDTAQSLNNMIVGLNVLNYFYCHLFLQLKVAQSKSVAMGARVIQWQSGHSFHARVNRNTQDIGAKVIFYTV